MLDRPIINHSTIENAIRIQYMYQFLEVTVGGHYLEMGREDSAAVGRGVCPLSNILSLSQFVTTPSPVSLSSRRSPYLLCECSHRDRDNTHRT